MDVSLLKILLRGVRMEPIEKIIFLRSKRVVLRPFERGDLPKAQKYINDPKINQYLMCYLPMRIEDEENWYSKTLGSNTNIIFSIVADNKFIGTIGIHDIKWKDRTATTGTLIGEKEYQNKGYRSEAKMLLLNYAFNTLNLRKIKSTVFDFNKRSYEYSSKCGYKIEGVLKKETFVDGKYVDVIQTAVFKEDWEPLWLEFTKNKL